MIYGNIKNRPEYADLDKQIQACFDYAGCHDMSALAKGSHEIDGDTLFVNIVEYETTAAENRFWEAHRQYLDLHFMIQGAEQIDLNFIENMVQKKFVEEDDFLPMNGEPKASVVLDEDDFLICYPHDAHRTAVQTGQPRQVKKAIFKIRIA